MEVEIGHFYLSDRYRPGALDYLKKQRFNDGDRFHLFLDDYHADTNVLDIHTLKTDAQELVGGEVNVEFEASMVQYYEEAFKLLDPADITATYFADNCTIYHRGRTIYDITKKRPSCQMLSFIWTLYRLGHFTGEENQVLTIIDSKYTNLEKRVFEMLPIEMRKRVFYRFF